MSSPDRYVDLLGMLSTNRTKVNLVPLYFRFSLSLAMIHPAKKVDFLRLSGSVFLIQVISSSKTGVIPLTFSHLEREESSRIYRKSLNSLTFNNDRDLSSIVLDE